MNRTIYTWWSRSLLLRLLDHDTTQIVCAGKRIKIELTFYVGNLCNQSSNMITAHPVVNMHSLIYVVIYACMHASIWCVSTLHVYYISSVWTSFIQSSRGHARIYTYRLQSHFLPNSLWLKDLQKYFVAKAGVRLLLQQSNTTPHVYRSALLETGVLAWMCVVNQANENPRPLCSLVYVAVALLYHQLLSSSNSKQLGAWIVRHYCATICPINLSCIPEGSLASFRLRHLTELATIDIYDVCSLHAAEASYMPDRREASVSKVIIR